MIKLHIEKKLLQIDKNHEYVKDTSFMQDFKTRLFFKTDHHENHYWAADWETEQELILVLKVEQSVTLS